MIWEEADKGHFQQLSQQNQGQIALDSKVGQFISSCARDTQNTTYLEVGTWNGLGSTYCFVDGLVARADNPYTFFSLECNAEKSEYARRKYENIPDVHILNEVLTNQITEEEVKSIFPVLNKNTLYAHWNKVDLDNMKTAKVFLQRTDIPEVFDVVLLDGGEFVTWFEFLCICERCKTLILDDTRTYKCFPIVQTLKNDPRWETIFESNERNGTAAFRRISW